jgi:NAD(P)-dependent dehydrogenase (short-subunit alcohol dehydrogenase family)
MQLKPIEQQVVAVVGAASGIGRETARRFAQRGAAVVVAARSQSGLESLVTEIRQAGGEATAIVADVLVFEQVQAIAEKAVATYGRLDTWVHVPAVGLFATVEQTTPDEYKRILDVNLMGQIYGAKAALPHLRQAGGGALIHISSMEGRRALPLQSAYSTSKHALEGFLESLRVELQHEGAPISVASIKPAVINTPFYSNARTKLGVLPTGIPPYYQPDLVADAVLYAAEHPSRDLIVGDVGRILDLLQRLSPGLVDTLLATFGFPLQQTDRPKPETAPDNLDQPLPEHDRVEGEFSHLTIPSLTDWFSHNPAVKWGAAAAVGVGALAIILGQSLQNQGKL